MDKKFQYEYSLANTIKKAVDLDISILETVVEAYQLKYDYEKNNKKNSDIETIQYVINGLNMWYKLK